MNRKKGEGEWDGSRSVRRVVIGHGSILSTVTGRAGGATRVDEQERASGWEWTKRSGPARGAFTLSLSPSLHRRTHSLSVTFSRARRHTSIKK